MAHIRSHKRPVAACVVIFRDQAILAVSRKKDATAYGLPAGKIEDGESPEAAAVRELFEETGIVVSAENLTFVYEGMVGSKLVQTYTAHDPGGEIQQSEEGVVIWAGWPSLLNGPFGAYNQKVREALENLPEHWITKWGSGSLRRAVEENLAWRDMYLHERAAFEVGYGFDAVFKSRLTMGKALAEGDNPATTETCWWARALRWRGERDQRPAKISVVHARLDRGVCEDAEEGVAILYEPNTRPSWLPSDRVLIAFTTHQGKTVNPC